MITVTGWNSGKPLIRCYQEIHGDALVKVVANVIKIAKKSFRDDQGPASNGLAVSILTKASPKPFIDPMPQTRIKTAKYRAVPLNAIPYGVNTAGKQGGCKQKIPVKAMRGQAAAPSPVIVLKPVVYGSAGLSAQWNPRRLSVTRRNWSTSPPGKCHQHRTAAFGKQQGDGECGK